jgi:hypothetical protein
MLALGVLALSLLVTPAGANTLTVELVGGAPVFNIGTGNYDWTYTIELSAMTSLNMGPTVDPGPPPILDLWSPDFVEIYDFAGLVGLPSFTAVAAGFANTDFLPSTPNQDTLAETAIFGALSGEVLTDQGGPNNNNIKLSFNNATPFTNSGSSKILLGTLKASSKYGGKRTDTYIGTDTKSGGAPGRNSDSVSVPVVPTPQTVWGGLALFSVMGLAKARRFVGV